MSPKVRLRQRIRVLMHMVMAFVIMILLVQLWLFTATLDAMESRGTPAQTVIAALICSFVGCSAIWALIRFFLRAEGNSVSDT